MNWIDLITPAIVLALSVFVYHILRDMKKDVGERQAEMKADLAGSQAEMKADLAGSQAEMKADLAGSQAEMKADIRELRENVVQVRERIASIEMLLTHQHPAE